ncbi:MAG: TIGR04282 family arsenosugar biosynthesis glycosyltransferase [Gammaproteobacteria bacterium]
MNPEAGTALIVFSKAPEIAKHRLADEIGRAEATHTASLLLDDALVRGRAAALAPRYLYWDGPPTHPSLSEAVALGYTSVPQAGGDLGERMANALSEVLNANANANANAKALLIGTDCPDLDADALNRAAAALTAHDAVLAPARDGGYVLVGLNRHALPHLHELFVGIAWGAAEVADITRRRMTACGLKFSELPPLEDLDRYADLDRLARRHPFLARVRFRERKSAG